MGQKIKFMNHDIKISKLFTVRDWKELRFQLIDSDDSWIKAYEIFEDRLKSRFFNPIDLIKTNGKNEGEGFSIALISIVMLEFIAAFEHGKIYKTSNEELSPNEYYSGRKILILFIKESKVFKSHFSSNTEINNFYANIRCGLVHEARTKESDVIISEGSIKNTNKEKIYFKKDGEGRLNRDLLLSKIREHLEGVKQRILSNDKDIRNNFMLKMDEISGLKHVWYFIYGSNLFEIQLKERLAKLNEIYLKKERCSLEGYQFKYNKESIDGTSKGNIIHTANGIVQGVAILILESKLDQFIERWERGYEKLEVSISTENYSDKNEKLRFKAYTCISKKHTLLAPSPEYVSKVMKGAIENELPTDYINKYMKYYE
jgi:hypothetical protein